jgi:hypothetical protein
LLAGKKKLTRNSRDVYRIVTPLGLWGTMIIIVYGVTVSSLYAIRNPFQELNMINFLVFRITRGVLFALEMCAAHTDEIKVRNMLSNSCRVANIVRIPGYCTLALHFPMYTPEPLMSGNFV